MTTNSGHSEMDMASRYARFMLRYRWAVIVTLFASTLFASFYVTQVNLRNDPDSLLPASNRYIATNLYSDLTFGMGNLMVWGLKVKDGDIYQDWFVTMFDELYDDLIKLDHAHGTNFIGLPSPKLRHLGAGEGGGLDLKRLVPANGLSADDTTRKAQLDYLRKGLEQHLVLAPLLVYYEDEQGKKCDILSAEGHINNVTIANLRNNCTAKATFIIGDFDNALKDAPVVWVKDLKKLMAEYEDRYEDRVEFLISGEPYFLASMVQELEDKAWLFGVSLLIVLLVLWYEFRHWSCAVLPLLGVTMTIVLTLGLMGFTQFKLTTMMALTPMLLLAIGIGHSMQVTRRFMQELQTGVDVEVAAFESIRRTIVPAALSIGTDLHGFFAISFVDISFYKAYAYFGIFGLSTLILTTTTLIPLLMVTLPPNLKGHEEERGWARLLAKGMTAMLMGPAKWLPVALVILVIWTSAHYAELGRGVSAIMSGEAGRVDAEVARIQDEFDIMPGAEKGIHYPRAAYKDHYLLGEMFGNGEVKPIADLMKLSDMVPGVITANMVVRSKAGTLPSCGMEAWSDEGERLIGPERCYDELEDPVQGIFNDAEVLGALSDFEDWLRAHPHIGYTVSYVQFIKTINMVLNAPSGSGPLQHLNLYAVPTLAHMQANAYAYQLGNDPNDLPDSNSAIQLYNGILFAGSGAGELDSFVNTGTWDESIIIAFVNTMDPVETHRTVLDIQNYLMTHANDPGMSKVKIGVTPGEQLEVMVESDSRSIVVEGDAQSSVAQQASIGGFLGVTEATRDVAFTEWLHAPLATSMTVLIMTALMFRSWLAAGILVSLCFITLLSQYGLGGYMSSIKEWSANLAFHVQVALSIAMGLGVDYGVYMISRLREEMRKNGQNWRQSLQTTLGSTGSAIIISVVVLLGSFIPLMNTELANLWSVSLYIAEALILDLLLALMLLPLLVYWLKPKFVFASDDKE